MLVKFVWLYFKLLSVLVAGFGLAGLIFAWRYGYPTLLRRDVIGDMTIDLIAIPLIVLIVTLMVFVQGESRKK